MSLNVRYISNRFSSIVPKYPKKRAHTTLSKPIEQKSFKQNNLKTYLQSKARNLKTYLETLKTSFSSPKSQPVDLSKYKTIITPSEIEQVNSKTIFQSPQTYNFIDADNARIMQKHNPIIMPRAALPKDKIVVEVSNFDYPYGTISATTNLEGCIVTAKLYQCAGLAIVDKSNNLQTLMHCFPGQSPEDISNLLKHILSKNNEKLQITIIPGAYDDCDKTITCLHNAIKNLAPSNKIRFANFSQETKIFDRAVILNNGKLTCCSNCELENLPNKAVNPKEIISYIKDEKKVQLLNCDV